MNIKVAVGIPYGYFYIVALSLYKNIATIAFQRDPERIASYSSGRGSNKAAFLLQLMMRTLGSNNLADCSDLWSADTRFQ